MVQTVEPWRCNDPWVNAELRCSFPGGGYSLFKRKTGPVSMAVTDVLVHKAFQMPFIYSNHIVGPRQA
jgi:hypothetical protein